MALAPARLHAHHSTRCLQPDSACLPFSPPIRCRPHRPLAGEEEVELAGMDLEMGDDSTPKMDVSAGRWDRQFRGLGQGTCFVALLCSSSSSACSRRCSASWRAVHPAVCTQGLSPACLPSPPHPTLCARRSPSSLCCRRCCLWCSRDARQPATAAPAVAHMWTSARWAAPACQACRPGQQRQQQRRQRSAPAAPTAAPPAACASRGPAALR